MDTRVNIVNISVLYNLIYRCNSILVKISASYFVASDKLILKFMWRNLRPRIANTILKKNKSWGLPLSKFNSYSSYSDVELAKELAKIYQWHEINSSYIDPHKSNQLIFDKGAKAIQWTMDKLFNKWRWKNWTSTGKRGKEGIDADLTPLK